MKYEVIVPVFNGEDVIEACLESITAQEHAAVGKDYSVLVIDDGSTDRTVEIAGKFPVKIISLGENRGRTAARLTGAHNARAARLLFVDSRVMVPHDCIASLAQFDSFPAVIGAVEMKQDGQSFWERILFLIRRKYYGKANFPVQGKDLIITPANFQRSQKGTTLLLIDADLFIRFSPRRSGKDVSDDTILFHNLVFTDKLKLLRSSGIKAKYDPARSFLPFLKWLYERGLKFADYYLAKGGRLQTHFRIVLALALAFACAGVILPAHVSLVLLWVLWVFYLFLCVWLSETMLDFPILFSGLPVILSVFGAGVLVSRVKSFFAVKPPPEAAAESDKNL